MSFHFLHSSLIEFTMRCSHVQVVAYWSRGQAAVEMKATKHMKKREAQFIPIQLRVRFKLFFVFDPCYHSLVPPLPCQLAFICMSSIKGASFMDIVKPCCELVWRSLGDHGSGDVRCEMIVSSRIYPQFLF